MLIARVQIPTRRIGLPYLDQGVGYRTPVFIDHTAAHQNSFADRLTCVLAGQISISSGDTAIAKYRPSGLGQ
jgi:hypothetical protein